MDGSRLAFYKFKLPDRMRREIYYVVLPRILDLIMFYWMDITDDLTLYLDPLK